eukprot:scaffold28630_cov37-Tisochrysis_lutea.AAC.1
MLPLAPCLRCCNWQMMIAFTQWPNLGTHRLGSSIRDGGATHISLLSSLSSPYIYQCGNANGKRDSAPRQDGCTQSSFEGMPYGDPSAHHSRIVAHQPPFPIS